MWVLLLFIYNVGIPEPTVAFIEKYTTKQECQDTRDYITVEMNKIYSEANFELKCEYRTPKA